MASGPGETWVYESLLDAVPGVDVRPSVAAVVQFAGFEAAVLALVWLYELPGRAAVAGTVAVAVAAAGSAAMLRIAGALREPGVPAAYRRHVLGTSVEVVLGLLTYVGLLTYLFVADPGAGPPDLLAGILGPTVPAPAAYLGLLVLWDVCYRIGTAWWASVAALWRSARLALDPETARRLRRTDVETMAFGLAQLALVPFVTAHPLLLWGLVGHVVAVVAVTAASVALLGRRELSST